MSGIRPNELEERRVIRLLSEVAAEVAPLPQEDVDDLLESATGGVSTRRGSRRRRALHLRHLIATGAAAAVVIGAVLGSTVSGSRPAADGSATLDGRLATFPEGSALQLLLSDNRSDRSS